MDPSEKDSASDNIELPPLESNLDDENEDHFIDEVRPYTKAFAIFRIGKKLENLIKSEFINILQKSVDPFELVVITSGDLKNTSTKMKKHKFDEKLNIHKIKNFVTDIEGIFDFNESIPNQDRTCIMTWSEFIEAMGNLKFLFSESKELKIMRVIKNYDNSIDLNDPDQLHSIWNGFLYVIIELMVHLVSATRSQIEKETPYHIVIKLYCLLDTFRSEMQNPDDLYFQEDPSIESRAIENDLDETREMTNSLLRSNCQSRPREVTLPNISLFVDNPVDSIPINENLMRFYYRMRNRRRRLRAIMDSPAFANCKYSFYYLIILVVALGFCILFALLNHNFYKKK